MAKKKITPKSTRKIKPAETLRKTGKIKKKSSGLKGILFQKAKPSDLKWMAIALPIIAILTFIVYYPALESEFTNWDDHKYVEENTMLDSDTWESRGWSTWDGIKEIATTPVAANHHPVTMLSLAFNTNFSQPVNAKTGKKELSTYPFKVGNLILHILNALMVFFFIYLLSGKRVWVGVITAFFFAIHPMHVESIAWVAARKDSLYTFFFLLGLIFYLKYLQAKKMPQQVAWYVAIAVSFVLSAFAKPAAVVFPVVLVLIDLFFLMDLSGRKKTPFTFGEIMSKLFKKALYLAPFFAISLYVGWLTIVTQKDFGAIGDTEIYNLSDKFLFANRSLMVYVAKYFVPIDLSTFHPYPNLKNLPASYYYAPFVVLLSLGALFWFFRKNKVVVFGVLFFLINIALVLQFLSVGNAVMAERYTYVPYIGITFMLAWAFQHFLEKKKQLPMIGMLAFLLISAGAFAYENHVRAKVWVNSGTLWSDVLDQYPNEFTARYNRGLYLSKTGGKQTDKALKTKYYEMALADYSHGLTIRKKSFQGHINRGTVLRVLERFDESLADFNKAVAISESEEAGGKQNPEWRLGYANRATINTLLKNYEAAANDYSEVIKRQPTDFKSLFNRGNSYYQEAKKRQDSGQPGAQQFYDMALVDLNKVIEKEPQNREAIFNRSVVYSNMGNKEAAKQDVIKARSMGKQVKQSYLNWLGLN